MGLLGIVVTGCVTTSRNATKGKDMTTLEGLNWKAKWVSHLGCLKGCLDYLNVEVSDA